MRLIDADAAIRWVKQECNPYGKPTLDFESGKRVMEHLERMPSIQSERKTGRWILVASGRGGYECSCCHEYAPSYRCGEDRLSNFCPNCGADMRGEENEIN